MKTVHQINCVTASIGAVLVHARKILVAKTRNAMLLIMKSIAVASVVIQEIHMLSVDDSWDADPTMSAALMPLALMANVNRHASVVVMRSVM